MITYVLQRCNFKMEAVQKCAHESHMHMKLLHSICLAVTASLFSIDCEGNKAFRPLHTVSFQWHVAKAAYTDEAIKAFMPSHSF